MSNAPHAEAARAGDLSAANIMRTASLGDKLVLRGKFDARCFSILDVDREAYANAKRMHDLALRMGDFEAAGHFLAVAAEMEVEKWVDEAPNLVFNAGLVLALDTFFAGSAYTAAFYLGLVDGGSAPTYNAADTMASHAGWTESTAYSNSTRVAPTFNSATASGGGSGTKGTGSKATTATSFNINATATIAGCLIATNSTKGGTTGTCYSAGSFTGGNRSVANLDTLQVTYTGQL
jgi:hypothetical protein